MRLSKLELRIMDILWTRGSLPIREVQEAFPEPDRPAYTTIQTTIYRMEEKQAVRRLKKIGNAHIFEPLIDREETRGSLIDDILRMFGGTARPMMAHLVETGKLTMDDVKEAEKLIKSLDRKRKEDAAK